MPISSLEYVAMSVPYEVTAANLVAAAAQARTILVPVSPQSFDATEAVQEITDDGRRGIDSMYFNIYRGVNITDIKWNGIINDGAVDQSLIIASLLQLMMLPTSAKNGAVVTGKTPHVITMGEPSNRKRIAVDVEHYVGELPGSVTPSRVFRFCRPTELTINFNAGEGSLTYSLTMQGRGADKAATPVRVEDKTSALFSGWQGQAYLGYGGADIVVPPTAFTNAAYNVAATNKNPRLISGTWTFRRSGKPVYTLRNSREFSNYTLGPLDVMFSGMFEYESPKEYDLFKGSAVGLQAADSKFATLFTNGINLELVNSRAFGISVNKMSWFGEPARIDTSEEFVKLALSGKGIHDTDDGFFSTGLAGIIGNAKRLNGPAEILVAQSKPALDYVP